jgi:DNA repair exonuclease SbcCD ATPase subunit
MSADMFQHIIGLNSYTTPFLALKAADQRTIIEQLLGITLLSEKADAIKELNKKTKEDITREEFRVKGVEEANKRITEQIESLKRRQGLWTKKYDSDLAYLVNQYDELTQVDITAELLAHKDLALYNEQKRQIEQFQSILERQTQWKNKNQQEITALESGLEKKNKLDIATELQAHQDLATYNELSKKITETKTWITRCEADERREQKTIDKLRAEIAELEAHKCYACGQEFHDDKHSEVLKTKQTALQEAALQALATNTQWLGHTDTLVKLGELGQKPTTHYKTEAEAVKHSSEIANLEQQIASKRNEVDPYEEQLTVEPPKLGRRPTTIYKTEAEAIRHSNTVANLEQQITTKTSETDPYSEQIADMEANALQELSYDEINRLNRVLQHQDYLLDLLTNKKSFVRKRIIEQNLAYLNNRLTHYLERMGLPHQVLFQNDLSVEITELGRELDFDNLSRGERNRLILGLSFAFRDVWESLYSPVNALFVDELIDNGLDTIGVENSLALLKDMMRKRNKSIWLVSHRDELVSRVSSVLKVVKESGFTSYSSETETV